MNQLSGRGASMVCSRYDCIYHSNVVYWPGSLEGSQVSDHELKVRPVNMAG